MKIDVEVRGLPDMRLALKGFEDQIPKAVAQSITFTAERVQRDLVNTMAQVFNSPTPFTLNSVRKTSATPSKLFAEVRLKDEAPLGTPASRYLSAQIDGGKRDKKGLERSLRFNSFISDSQFMVPGDDAALNAYGNIAKSQIVKALSNIKAQRDSSANTASEKAKTRQRKSGRQYFWMRGAGIYWREGNAGLRSFMVITQKPNYERRFDFFGISERSVTKHLPEQFQRSVDRVLRSAPQGPAP